MRDRIVIAVRRAIEAVLPWYDPQQQRERDEHVDHTVREARKAIRSVGSYGRVSVRR